MPRNRSAEAAGVGAYEEDRASCQSRRPSGCWELKLKSVHLGSINSNNWLPLLAFRERLIAGEVAPESSTASVASTEKGSETATVRGIRNTACRPISAAKTQQILDLEPTDMSVRAIARQVGTSTSTVKAVCCQAKQPPGRKRRFTDDDLHRARQRHAEGCAYIEIDLELGLWRDTVKMDLEKMSGQSGAIKKHCFPVDTQGGHKSPAKFDCDLNYNSQLTQ